MIAEVADQRNPSHVSPQASAEVVPSCVIDVSSSAADDSLPDVAADTVQRLPVQLPDIRQAGGKMVAMRAAGINVEAGTLLLAIVERSDGGPVRPVTITCPRLARNINLPEAEGLRDLAQRVKQELEAAKIDAVGLVQTRAFRNCQYNLVYSRVTAICAVMFAAAELDVHYETLATETIGAAVGRPAKAVGTLDCATLGLGQRPKYWTTGLAEAYAAAATLVGGTQ